MRTGAEGGGFRDRRGVNTWRGRVARTRRADAHGGIMHLDLDGFEAGNERLGHDGGNAVLIVARRIRAETLEADPAARLAGQHRR